MKRLRGVRNALPHRSAVAVTALVVVAVAGGGVLAGCSHRDDGAATPGAASLGQPCEIGTWRLQPTSIGALFSPALADVPVRLRATSVELVVRPAAAIYRGDVRIEADTPAGVADSTLHWEHRGTATTTGGAIEFAFPDRQTDATPLVLRGVEVGGVPLAEPPTLPNGTFSCDSSGLRLDVAAAGDGAAAMQLTFDRA